MQTETIQCKRCGECCEKGGPALHTQDAELVRNGDIPISSLITLRKGELAHNPVSGQVQPLTVELVKLTGTGRQWHCVYYASDAGCTIYDNRPHACRALKCWDTEDVLALVEKDTLDRIAILGDDHPMVPIIREHERICPCCDLAVVHDKKGKLSDSEKKKIEKAVRLDLRFRGRIIKDFDLKLSEELFYFGRPLFQLLQPFGVRIVEDKNEIYLKW